jgi:hypothetical protein
MKVEKQLEARVQATFQRLNSVSASRAFPPMGALTKRLGELMPGDNQSDVFVDDRVAQLFATASVDAWLRSVHTFLISSSLTVASPMWAIVTGYYSSHYAVRALAHLLGYFLLFGRKRCVRIQLDGGRFTCSFDAKGASNREHKVYWAWVKHDTHFAFDPWFTLNPPINEANLPKSRLNPAPQLSDIAHRDRANYIDHLGPYLHFRPLNEIQLRDRAHMIASMEFKEPPIPELGRFPDVESVQIVAYYRLVKYRRFLDLLIGTKNRFWSVHRNPAFADRIISFQIQDPPRFEIPTT